MKKLIVAAIVAIAIVTGCTIGFANGYTAPHRHGDREILETGTKCISCNGTGFNGQFNCGMCKGTGRNGSY